MDCCLPCQNISIFGDEPTFVSEANFGAVAVVVDFSTFFFQLKEII
jgi:hypothetical protein